MALLSTPTTRPRRRQVGSVVAKGAPRGQTAGGWPNSKSEMRSGWFSLLPTLPADMIPSSDTVATVDPGTSTSSAEGEQ